MLEERKGELLQALAREQEQKLQRVRGLIRQYGDHLEGSSKLVESAIQSMEEPQMALYLQVSPGRWLAGCIVARLGALAPGDPGSRRTSGTYLPHGLGQVTPSESIFFLRIGICLPQPQPTPQDCGGRRKWNAARGWHNAYLLSPSFLPYSRPRS